MQVCAQGTAAGNVGIISKQFKAVGVRDWNAIKQLHEYLDLTLIDPGIDPLELELTC